MEAAAEPAGNVHVAGLITLMTPSAALLVSQVAGPHQARDRAPSTSLSSAQEPYAATAAHLQTADQSPSVTERERSHSNQTAGDQSQMSAYPIQNVNINIGNCPKILCNLLCFSRLIT